MESYYYKKNVYFALLHFFNWVHFNQLRAGQGTKFIRNSDQQRGFIRTAEKYYT